jgi:hypothetical protein
MARLFVPLDVNYAEDDKLIDVGPMAELLYLRSLAFVKRSRSNGIIRANQLTTIATRIPRAHRLADRLVDVGLWERNGAGWSITAWLKHNPPTTEVAGVKAEAGSRGAHIRWHVERRQPSADCEHCVADGLVQPMANR